MEFEGDPDWKPIFDPKAFCEGRDQLKVADFKLSNE